MITKQDFPAKNEVCRICKIIGHIAKLSKSEMPPDQTTIRNKEDKINISTTNNEHKEKPKLPQTEINKK